jgi:hypothetical protein
MPKQNLPPKQIATPLTGKATDPQSFKGFLLAAYKSIANNVRSLKITRSILIIYLLILVIIPPVFIVAAFFIFPLPTARFFNFQVKAQPSLFSTPNPQILGEESVSNVNQGSVLGEYIAAVLEPQAAATVKALRILLPESVSGVVLPAEEVNILQSVSGSPGSSGAMGSQGPAGTRGAQGPTGATGGAGSAGSQGAQGPTGATGATGSVGALSTGNGLSGNITSGDLTLDLALATFGTTTTNNSASGLETTSSGLSLIKGCSDDQVLAWNSATEAWECTTTTAGTGITSLNGLSGTAQTFTNDTNLTITSSGSTHALGWNGILPVNRGGLGVGTLTSNGLLLGNDTGAVQTIGPPSSGQLLLGNGSGVPTFTALSGDATITNSGVLTLKSVGTPGSYGSTGSIPVITTDTQGRVSGVINTAISGLTVSNFGSVNVSQWTNDSGYIIDGNTGWDNSYGFITDGNTGWDNSYGFITASSNESLTNKTISGTTNTLSNIGNSSLINSGLTITADNGLSGGGSVSLGGSTSLALSLTTSGTSGSTSSNSGLEVGASGLTLLHGCADGELMKWTDAGGWACAVDTSSGPSSLNTITAALGANTINNGDNAQVWNWNLTTAAKTAFSFGENIASTNGVGNQYILGLSTLAGSTAAPLKVSAQGNTIIDTTNTGGLTFGNTTGSTAVNINSGTGNVNFTVGPTSSSGKVQIGNSSTATPDLLVLDNGTADPAGINGGMYYNTGTGKFRCYENSAWVNCIGSSSGTGTDLLHAASYDTGEALTNVPTGGGQKTLGSVSVTPTTATGDVYVTGFAEVRSSNGIDQPFNLVIETTNNCTGSTVGNASVTYTITSAANTTHLGNIRVSGIAVDAGAFAKPYSLCARISSGGGDTDVLNWGIEALVIDTGADLAEIYTTNDSSIEEGDVVSLDPSLKTGMKKSQKPYDQNVLGIISTRPGLVIGGVDKEGVRAMPVALAGRVPVKVSIENGKIAAGDYLTTSSTPGVAMRSTRAGAIIGKAMTSFEGEEVGQILAYANNGFSLGSGLADGNYENEASRSAELAADSVIKANIFDQINKIMSDLFDKTVEFFGQVIFQADVTFLGRPTFNKDTAGHALIKAGQSEASIAFKKEYSSQPVVNVSVNLVGAVQPDEVPGYAVYDLSTKGFKVKLSRVAAFDLDFSWIALAVDGDNLPTGGVSDTPILNPQPIPTAGAANSTVTPSTLPTTSQEIVPITPSSGGPASPSAVGQ